MTSSEFQEITNKLCNLFSKELNEIQLDFWYKCLKEYDIISYRRAIGEYTKKNKYMPTISDILSEISKLKPYEEIKREQVECKLCKGVGIFIYKKQINGQEFEYACQCNCANAIGLDYDGTKIRDKDHRSKYYLAKAVDIFR